MTAEVASTEANKKVPQSVPYNLNKLAKYIDDTIEERKIFDVSVLRLEDRIRITRLGLQPMDCMTKGDAKRAIKSIRVAARKV